MAKNKETNGRITRWFLSLQPFNFSVIHRPGRHHGNADALSRRDAFWSSFTLPRTSGPGRGMCGITRGQVVDGCYIPTHKMAALTKPTTPRGPQHPDGCECVRHLIEAELGENMGVQGKRGERTTRSKRKGTGLCV